MSDLTAAQGPTRRRVLGMGAAAAGVAGVAVVSACSTGSRSDAAGAGGATGSGSADAKPLATLADIPVGHAVSVTLADGKPAVVARPSNDTAAAFSAICTHQGCTVMPAGAKLDCPCHGSQFNALTGAVLHGPAARPLPAVPIAVQDGKVVQT